MKFKEMFKRKPGSSGVAPLAWTLFVLGGTALIVWAIFQNGAGKEENSSDQSASSGSETPHARQGEPAGQKAQPQQQTAGTEVTVSAGMGLTVGVRQSFIGNKEDFIVDKSQMIEVYPGDEVEIKVPVDGWTPFIWIPLGTDAHWEMTAPRYDVRYYDGFSMSVGPDVPNWLGRNRRAIFQFKGTVPGQMVTVKVVWQPSTHPDEVPARYK